MTVGQCRLTADPYHRRGGGTRPARSGADLVLDEQLDHLEVLVVDGHQQGGPAQRVDAVDVQRGRAVLRPLQQSETARLDAASLDEAAGEAQNRWLPPPPPRHHSAENGISFV